VLHTFQGGSDGSYPFATPVVDNSGAVYGTTLYGGGGCPSLTTDGCGTVYKLTPSAAGSGPWTETVLYRFKGGSDGRGPNGGLVFDASGALYGATVVGGAFDQGTVYKLAPPASGIGPWTETILYDFKGGTDGALPYTTLIFDSKGSLYGVTDAGGTHSWCGTAEGRCGTVS
jgi:uncharacterized repeat protein (TIGR03803 family)